MNALCCDVKSLSLDPLLLEGEWEGAASPGLALEGTQLGMERNCGLLFFGQTLQRQWMAPFPVASVWVEPLKNGPVGRDPSV